MNIAYLTTMYPYVSHTFIRRELLAIEQSGYNILRLSIRQSDAKIADPVDMSELTKTIHCLSLPITQHLASLLRTIFTRPKRFFSALATALSMSKRSDRGLLKHIAYILEASTLLYILEAHSVRHIHVHFGTNATAVARLVKLLGGPSYSFTVHGPDEFDAAIAFDLHGKIKDAAFVVAITDFCSAQLKRWSDPCDWPKIHKVHCTVGDEFFSARTPISADSNIFVCVGRLSAQKGQLILLDAFKRLIDEGNDARLVFVGDGELRKIIEDKIDSNGLQDKVTITGYVSESEVRTHILESRALVMPSFAEGLPMVIMEAFAVGRPVISTYIAGIPELVQDKTNGWLVPAGCIEQLTNALKEALSMEAKELEEMASKGKELTYKNHRTATEAERLKSLFDHYIESGISDTDSNSIIEDLPGPRNT